jgi:hypothetical protein
VRPLRLPWAFYGLQVVVLALPPVVRAFVVIDEAGAAICEFGEGGVSSARLTPSRST